MNASTLPSLESASSKSTTFSFVTAFVCFGFTSASQRNIIMHLLRFPRASRVEKNYILEINSPESTAPDPVIILLQNEFLLSTQNY